MADKPILEEYEWDDLWWERNDDTTHPRLMYVGDSISRGIRQHWNGATGARWYLDNYATSKAVDNPFIIPMAVNFFRQQPNPYDAVLVNGNMHGWHLTDDAFRTHYEALIKALKEACGDVPLVVVTSSAFVDGEKDKTVQARNAIAKALAEKFDLPVIDLYPLSQTLPYTDGAHLTGEGYCGLARLISDVLPTVLGQ